MKWMDKMKLKEEDNENDLSVDEDGFLKSYIEVCFDDDN